MSTRGAPARPRPRPGGRPSSASPRRSRAAPRPTGSSRWWPRRPRACWVQTRASSGASKGPARSSAAHGATTGPGWARPSRCAAAGPCPRSRPTGAPHASATPTWPGTTRPPAGSRRKASSAASPLRCAWARRPGARCSCRRDAADPPADADHRLARFGDVISLAVAGTAAAARRTRTGPTRPWRGRSARWSAPSTPRSRDAALLRARHGPRPRRRRRDGVGPAAATGDLGGGPGPRHRQRRRARRDPPKCPGP
jgi:hypothetical protein